jgi:hypothetical protein
MPDAHDGIHRSQRQFAVRRVAATAMGWFADSLVLARKSHKLPFANLSLERCARMATREALSALGIFAFLTSATRTTSCCFVLASLLSACGMMPNRMISEDGSSIRFTDKTGFNYQQVGQSPVRCERTPDTDLNTMTNDGQANCADGRSGYFRRNTGPYFQWIEVQFDGRTFVEPGKPVRSWPYGATEPPQIFLRVPYESLPLITQPTRSQLAR